MGAIDTALRADLAPGALLCPRCALHVVIPGTVAGDRYGVCEACYLHALANARNAEIAKLEAKRDYDASRQNLHRERKRNGLPTNSQNIKPVF